MAHSVIILDIAGESMGGGSWRDQIVCTLRADRTFSLRGQKTGDDGPDLQSCALKGIRDPERFVQAVTEIVESLGSDIELDDVWGEICEALEILDKVFAQRVRDYAAGMP